MGPEGLKPNYFRPLTARLKVVPDTKHERESDSMTTTIGFRLFIHGALFPQATVQTDVEQCRIAGTQRCNFPSVLAQALKTHT
jgi:hypothetical protein